MEFEKHAFISYAHDDNKPLSKNDKGWISNFHASLEIFITWKLGKKPRIWRDQKLQGSDIFSDEIVQQFPKTALLISVVTPCYINSEWCTREIKEFCNSAAHNIGIRIGNKSRILKVLKTPVERNKIPPEMEGTLGYEFYKLDENGPPIQFNKCFGEDAEKEFLKKVDDLAHEITGIIKLLDTSEADEPVKNTASSSLTKQKVTSIYVAQTSYDLNSERDLIIRELKAYGYNVFPDKNLSSEEEELGQEVAQYLDHCQLSVHLVGKLYGGIPDGPTQKSVNVLQNEIAALKSKATGLPRIIWMPHGLQFNDERQQEFVTLLNEDETTHYGADVIKGSIEDLKAALKDKIKQLENPVEKKEPTDDEKKVYLICDAQDRELTLPLRKYLISQNFEVTIPLFEGDPSAIREDHEENLRSCDALIIFYGKGDEAWKRSKVNELKKMNAYKRDKPLLGNYTYLAEPGTMDKRELVELDMPNVINGLEGFSPDIMRDFMKKVAQPA